MGTITRRIRYGASNISLSLSDSGIIVDVKCSFLIELAEPLIEIVKSILIFSPL